MLKNISLLVLMSLFVFSGCHPKQPEINLSNNLNKESKTINSHTHPTVAEIKKIMQKASEEFEVPVIILETVGYLENNWTQVGPSIDQGWGIMHLVSNNYAQTLTEAAELLGLDPQVLKDDARENIRGAAALLNHYAKLYKIERTNLENWFQPLMPLTGLINDKLRAKQVYNYYKIMYEGVEEKNQFGEIIKIPANSEINIDKVKRLMLNYQ